MRGWLRKCFDLLNDDGGYPLDSGLSRLVACMRLQRPPNCPKLHSHGLPSRAVG